MVHADDLGPGENRQIITGGCRDLRGSKEVGGGVLMVLSLRYKDLEGSWNGPGFMFSGILPND